MSLIPARWRRPVATTSPEVEEVGAGGAVGPAKRLTAPRGSTFWVCATSTGRVGCAHDSERAAEEHGQPVWWPITIEGDVA